MSLEKGKSRKSRKTSNSKMYDVFVGTYITVAIKDLLGVGKDAKFANLMIGGILLEECDSFIYLGSPEGINAAIPKVQIVGVFLDADEIMDQDEVIPPGTVRQ